MAVSSEKEIEHMSVTVTSYKTGHMIQVYNGTQLVTWIDCTDKEALEVAMEHVKQVYHPSEITRIIKR